MPNKPPIKTEECECPCMWCYRDDPKHDKCGFDCNYTPSQVPSAWAVPEKECNHGNDIICIKCAKSYPTPLNTEEKCYDCYAHYPKGFDHKCDGLMKMLVSKHKEKENKYKPEEKEEWKVTIEKLVKLGYMV